MAEKFPKDGQTKVHFALPPLPLRTSSPLPEKSPRTCSPPVKMAQRSHPSHDRSPRCQKQPEVTSRAYVTSTAALVNPVSLSDRKRKAAAGGSRRHGLWASPPGSVQSCCILGHGRHWSHDLQTAEADKAGQRVAIVFVDCKGKTLGPSGATTAAPGKGRPLFRRHCRGGDQVSKGAGSSSGRLYASRDLLLTLERAVTDVGLAGWRHGRDLHHVTSPIPSPRSLSLSPPLSLSDAKLPTDAAKQLSSPTEDPCVSRSADVQDTSDVLKGSQVSRPVTHGKRVQFRDAKEVVKARLRIARLGHSASFRKPGQPGGSRSPHKDAVMTSATDSAPDAEDVENRPPPVSRMYRKFRLVGLIVMKLVRLKAAIAVNSQDRTVRSAAEIQWRTLYGEQEAEKLAFNKTYFSRERVSTKMPQWALSILHLSPEERTPHDCHRLHTLFRSMRSFLKFTERIQLSLCRAFEYEWVGEGRIVLRRGHVGHNFYFIYSGSVFVNVQDIDSEGQPFVKTEAVLGMGDSFGELALLQDIRRTATISVRETCELLVVEKEVFARICPQIFDQELVEKQEFVSRMPLFSSTWWLPDTLRQLCMEAQIQEYKINKIVVEDNSREEWLYICMEGQCQVIRCLTLGGGEEEPLPTQDKDPVVLSEEILEILMKPKRAESPNARSNEDENSKEKMLSSLRLEYVKTGKRRSIFIEEVEDEERRKVKAASAGPTTLTSVIAQQQREFDTSHVYLHVDVLNSGGVFDMGSLIKAPVKRKTSKLLLVSSGARMFRVKKAAFFRLASLEAIEHTRTLLSQQRIPSEAELLESYKQKMSWDDYKTGVVHDVVQSRDLRLAPLFRSSDTKTQTNLCTKPNKEQKTTSNRLITALNRFTDVEKRNKLARQRSLIEMSRENSGLDVGDNESRNIFPVQEVVEEDDSDDENKEAGSPRMSPRKPSMAADDRSSPRPETARRPSTVVVRRRSSVVNNGRSMVSSESSFVIRRRHSRADDQTELPRKVVSVIVR